jgi:hypothetical protein
MTDLRDNPSEIAEFLVKDNGLENAIQMANEGTTKAQQVGDNYALSVWREVKVILRNKRPDT